MIRFRLTLALQVPAEILLLYQTGLNSKLLPAAIMSVRSHLQTGFVFLQPFCESRDAFIEIDLRSPAQLAFRKRNIQRIAVAVGTNFGGVRVLAYLE